MEEIWKDIKGYEGLYQVSNLGRVRSLKHRGKNEIRIRKIRIRKDNYMDISLYKNGKAKYELIHRLVAEYFVYNPKKYKYVNHKDGNKHNNIYTNLEWVTASENTQHAYENGLIDKEKLRKAGYRRCGKNHHMYGIRGSKNPNSKKVICITTGEIFGSIIEASEKYEINHSDISSCCKDKLKSAGKYPITGEKLVWKYIED